MMEDGGDLTNPNYWRERQAHLSFVAVDQPVRELIEAILPYLQGYSGGRFLEIGCSPGRVMSFLRQRLVFEPTGIDYSPEAWRFIESMHRVVGATAQLFNVDVREYDGPGDFDVVASFGLVEHFQDPSEIIYHHDRLCRSEGLVVISMPNFRHLQWLYHWTFDRSDLRKHNTEIMELNYFNNLSKKFNHDILFLGYVGSISFWGAQEGSLTFLCNLKKYCAVAVQIFVSKFLSRMLPANNKFYSPWIVYVARKR